MTSEFRARNSNQEKGKQENNRQLADYTRNTPLDADANSEV